MKWLFPVITLLLVLTIIACGTSVKQENTERDEELRSEGDRRMREEKGKQLGIGDVAPIFKLKSLDGKEETDLKEFRGKEPVVLIFGSYT